MSFLVRKKLISILGIDQEKICVKGKWGWLQYSMLNMTLSELINMQDLPNNGWQWPLDTSFLNENVKLRIIGLLPWSSLKMASWNDITRPLCYSSLFEQKSIQIGRSIRECSKWGLGRLKMRSVSQIDRKSEILGLSQANILI